MGRFLAGIRDWLLNLDYSDRMQVTFIYAGGDAGRVNQAGRVLEGLCRMEIHHYLGLEKLFELCRSSTVNAYLWSPTTFHHKLVELLCCGRPIITFPRETAEALQLADQVQGNLYPCRNGKELKASLENIRQQDAGRQPSCDNRKALEHFSWNTQGEVLCQVLAEVVEQPGKPKKIYLKEAPGFG